MHKRVGLASLVLALCLQAAGADVFVTPRPLSTFKTEHFSIIFSKESRSAAEYLARESEGIYDEVAAALNAPKTLHIPVVLSPDSDELDGYCVTNPSVRIVLFQGPISPNSGFTVYNDDLRKLFMHELTHAVSLTIRDPFWAFLAALFTDAIAPANLIAPANFVEGATVSMESRDGFGRAAETDFLGIVQQDIIEGRFKSFPESAGLWREYPNGIHYIYGGLFSRYLQETYGMEVYAALWKLMGKGDFIAGLEGWLFFKGAFVKAYSGLELEKAWKDFREYIALKRPVITALKPLTEEFERIGATCSDGRLFYWSESSAIKAYDPESGKTKKILDWDGAPNRLSVSPDGERLLISTERYSDGLPKMTLRVWNLKRKRWETAGFPNKLREAAWLPDGKGIVACRGSGFTLDLVRVEKGNMEILLKGSERLVPSCPCPLGPEEIAFLLKIDGIVRLARMDLSTKSVRLLDSGDALSSVRYLSSGPNGLSFSYDTDGSLFKLGRYGDSGLTLQQPSLSGGVRFPVELGENSYYIAAFSQGQKPMAFPRDNPDLAMKSVPSQWVDFDPAGSGPSAYDAPPELASKPYNPLPWIFIPQYRYPFLTTNEIGLSMETWRSYLNGAGIYGYGIDPTEAHALSWSLGYKWFDVFAQADLTYTCRLFPVDFSVSAYDRLGAASFDPDSGVWTMRRRLGLSAYASQNLIFLPMSRSFWWQTYASAALVADGSGGTQGISSSSPYLWPFSASILPFGGSVAYRDVITPAMDPNATRGIYLRGNYSGYLEPLKLGLPKGYLSAEASAYLPFLGAQITAKGAAIACPGLLLGPSGPSFSGGEPYLSGGDYPYYSDYVTSAEGQGPFFVTAEASLGYRFNIGQAIKKSDLYARELNMRSGYRAGFAGSEYLHSAFARMTVESAWTRGIGLGVSLTAGCEVDVLFSRQDYPGGYSFMLRPVFNYSY
jgi:hypothetical protein